MDTIRIIMCKQNNFINFLNDFMIHKAAKIAAIALNGHH